MDNIQLYAQLVKVKAGERRSEECDSVGIRKREIDSRKRVAKGWEKRERGGEVCSNSQDKAEEEGRGGEAMVTMVRANGRNRSSRKQKGQEFVMRAIGDGRAWDDEILAE